MAAIWIDGKMLDKLPKHKQSLDGELFDVIITLAEKILIALLLRECLALGLLFDFGF